MTPERMAGLVARWVRFYTRDLPTSIAQRRIDEIDADVRDHIAHHRAHGTRDKRIALSIAGRMVRGLAADASWRGQKIAHASAPKEVGKTSRTAYRSAVRVALATAFILLVPLVAMQITDEVDWSLADFVSPEPSWEEPVYCSSSQRGSRARSRTEPPPPRSASLPSC
jgi:hypothetical protein